MTGSVQKWARLYGWRSLSPLEIHARYVFYRHIGEMMNIRDIPDSIDELESWVEVQASLNCLLLRPLLISRVIGV